ncbi:MAG TPA: D-alanyl-D-alanine carboxypeptidase family protein [Dehalococcoidia bacterium]|nr:D-alanyl-D-alanine carboxypeptidase family protein [Dehalococcoidia bacterium]
MRSGRYRFGYLPPRRRAGRGRLLLLSLALACALGLLGLFLLGRGDAPSPSPTPEAAAAEARQGEEPAGALTGQGGGVPTPVRPMPTPLSAPPPVSGQAVAVVEEPCGALLYAVNEHEHLPPASLTKIVTALVAEERAPLSAMVTVNVDGGELNFTTGSSVMGLKPGMSLTLRDLLYGLLLPSGNDAALAIAAYVGGSVPAFVQMMNQEVQRLGLRDSQFRNPHGLDEPGHYSSAYDMAMLGRALLKRPELARIVSTRTYQPAWPGPVLWNNNLFLYSYEGAVGIKTGYTDEARQTIVAAAERGGRLLIVSVLRSEDVVGDASRLLDWAFASIAPRCSPGDES